MFETIFTETTLTISSILICLGVSILLGLIISFVHMYTTDYTKNFVITLSLLPTLVALVIIMVNGNLGTSVAVLGAFSLIRFRSIPGNSREIMSIFFVMVIGLALGMGHVVFASIATVIVSLLILILSKSKFGEIGNRRKELVINIPENLDYYSIFDEVFEKYTDKFVLAKIKTTNMGSIFELTYKITFKKGINEKEFIDDLRCRNGNLKILLKHSCLEGEL